MLLSLLNHTLSPRPEELHEAMSIIYHFLMEESVMIAFLNDVSMPEGLHAIRK